MAEEISRDRMAEVLPLLNVRPRLLTVYAMVKLYLEGRQNGSVVNLFRYAGILTSTRQDATSWAALKQNEFGKPEIFIQATTIDPEFIRTSTLALLELSYPLVKTYSAIELVAATEIADVAHQFFREKGSHPFCPLDEPAYYYYASDSDIAWLKQADVALPEGFEYVNLCPDQADEMVSVTLHGDEDDAKMVNDQYNEDLCDQVKKMLRDNTITSNALGQTSSKESSGFTAVIAVRCTNEFVWYELGWRYYKAAATTSDYVVSRGDGEYSNSCGQLIFLS